MAKQSSENWHGCPIRYAATVLGDAWSLLILRDMVFRGSCNFGDFVAAGERISTNILAERLKRLEAEGIVVRSRDPDNGVRVTYALTAKGRGLVPVLLSMIAWSAEWDGQSDVPTAFRDACREEPEALAQAVLHSLDLSVDGSAKDI